VGDDFFECLHVGDAIDDEVAESLFSMASPIVRNANYCQVSGAVGFGRNKGGMLAPLYLTVKKFGNTSFPWRYVGHCEKDDDIHLNNERSGR